MIAVAYAGSSFCPHFETSPPVIFGSPVPERGTPYSIVEPGAAGCFVPSVGFTMSVPILLVVSSVNHTFLSGPIVIAPGPLPVGSAYFVMTPLVVIFPISLLP